MGAVSSRFFVQGKEENRRFPGGKSRFEDEALHEQDAENVSPRMEKHTLGEESSNDLFFCLCLRQAQGLQFHDLLARNFPNGGLMNQRRVAMQGIQRRAAITVPFSANKASHSECPLQRFLPRITE